MFRGNLHSYGDLKPAVNPLSEPAHSPYFQLMHNPVIERLFGAAPAFIYVVNIKTQRLVYASSSLEHLYGYDHEALLDNDIEDVRRLMLKDDAEKAFKANLEFMEAIAALPKEQCRNVKSIINCRITRYDGSIVPVQQQKVVLETDSSGNPLLMMSMVTDMIGSRKNFEFGSVIMLRDPVKGWIELRGAATSCSDPLSAREKEILQLLASGKSSKIIASDLNISVNTVNNHRKNMLLKTGSSNIAGLVSYGLSHGII